MLKRESIAALLLLLLLGMHLGHRLAKTAALSRQKVLELLALEALELVKLVLAAHAQVE